MMDAVPLTLGQEFSGYVGMLDDDLERIELTIQGLYNLAIGGTAVGTGLNSPKGFSTRAVKYIEEITGYPFKSAPNKFSVQGGHDDMVMMSGALKTLAVSLYKIANDIRLMASGPRCGIQELIIPANEPGSSIMPGKVNPTQSEAMTMVAVQVMANDVAVNFAGAGGYLEMNVYKPIIAYNVLQSIRLMADACNGFTDFLVVDMKPNKKKIKEYLKKSLMLVTALSPIIGYDKSSEIAHLAHEKGITLKEAALELGYISEEEFDDIIDPAKMVGHVSDL
jgi:fumarate hydratase class II